MNRTRSLRAHAGANRLPAMFSSTAIIALMGCSLALAPAAHAQGLPTGGTVTAGEASISANPTAMTISQNSQNTAINWQTFNIAAGNSVQFIQPNSSSVALNKVIGGDASAIFGTLSANGQVFLINPNGVLFGRGAQVNVGGLVASTLDITDSDFMAGRYSFAGASRSSVINRGSINADGGYVALLGANISNQGLIQANMGFVALAAGTAITLDVAGDGLLNVAVERGAVEALVDNGGVLRANGGQVLMTAQAAGQLLKTVVNNSGVIEAQTLGGRDGRILLLADLQSGTVNVGGVLDASAPDGGDGGFIETSAASVKIAESVLISTAAALGKTGIWLIDPQDFIIGAGGDISGATLSAQLVTTNVTISTIPSAGDGTNGNGDIFVNDAVSWTASGDPTTLTLNALRDVNINAAITATQGNLVVCCGRDANVNAPITTTNGSILLNAGQDVNVFFAITTTDGNIVLCAGRDIHIDAAVTLTRGSTIPAEGLGLPVGLTLIAGAAGNGPGVEKGTLIFAPLAPPVTVTVAPVTIHYNPVSYSAPTDFSTRFVLTEGAELTQRMLLFPNGDKPFDGNTTAVLTGFNTTAVSGLPAGVNLVAGPGATATFDSAGIGSGIGITYAGYTLNGANADQYALAGSCCVSTFQTMGTIIAAASPPPPPPPPPPGPTPVPGTGTPPTSGTIDYDTSDGWLPVIAAPVGIALAVIGSGINMPAQLAEAAPAPLQVAQAPAPVPTPQAVREEQVRKAKIPVVRPRKQARN